MGNPKDSKDSKAAKAANLVGAAAPTTATDSDAGDPASESGAYKPVGKVITLAEAERDGKTVRVLMDDVRVWKEVA